MSIDLYLIHQFDETEPKQLNSTNDRPTAGGIDYSSPEGQDVELDRYDGDGEHRGAETWSDFDRALL